MKTIILLLLALMPFKSERGLITNDNIIVLVIDRSTTQNELTSYKSQLKEQFGITLDYETSFDETGMLEKVSLNVNCNDGFKGSFKTTLTKRKQKVGFCRDYNKGRKVPFIIGNLPKS